MTTLNKEKLKSYTQLKMKLARNAPLTLFEMMQGMEDLTRESVEKIYETLLPGIQEKIINDLKRAIEEIAPHIQEQVVGQLQAKLAEFVNNYDITEIKGDPGSTPTDDALIALMKPLIPKVKNGKTPSNKKLLSLIKPLIPQVKDGDTPTDERLLALILPLIQKAKDDLPDNPDEVVEKVNGSSKKIKTQQIEDFDKIIKNIRNSIREKRGGGSKGGGMGNPQHESKSVTSASTSVTTNSKIGANGYAIWAYYQGQMIVRGTHYTVGADLKTLTLLFTPQDSTAIDLIYIR
jgi:hypothetical protein